MRQQIFHTDAITQIAPRTKTLPRSLANGSCAFWGWPPRRMRSSCQSGCPDLPVQPREVTDVAATALAQRLDVRMARQGLDATVYALGLTRATRFVNVFDLALQEQERRGCAAAKRLRDRDRGANLRLG
jgi:outer membrane protein TolC